MKNELNPAGLAALSRALLLGAASDISKNVPGSARYNEGERFLRSPFADLCADYVGFDAELIRLAAENPERSRIITARGKRKK